MVDLIEKMLALITAIVSLAASIISYKASKRGK